MPVTTREGLLEAWATQIEAMEQNLESLYGPPGITPALPPVTTYEGMLEAVAEQTENTYVNIAKVSGAYHGSYDAYTIQLPATLLDWNGVERIGGRTIVWNQVRLDTGNTMTADGITTTYADGLFTITNNSRTSNYGTGSTRFAISTEDALVPGHTYVVCAYSEDNITGVVIRYSDSSNAFIDNDMNTIFTIATKKSNAAFYLRVTKDYDFVTAHPAGNVTKFKINITDLTLMFGSGNEPATAAEFKAMFPAEFYAYDKGSLLSAGVTTVVSKDSADTTVATYSIPAEVQTLTGYGWSCPSAYNYIDFKNKKYVQAVGSRSYSAGDESDATVITDGTTTHYTLTVPAETDISVDDIIEVKPGGTVTFENSHGDDYRIPVPITAEYIGV